MISSVCSFFLSGEAGIAWVVFEDVDLGVGPRVVKVGKGAAGMFRSVTLAMAGGVAWMAHCGGPTE